MRLSEMQGADLKRVFIFGEPGTGKTCFATGFPGPIKVFDFDNKIASAYNYWKVKDPSKLEQIDFTDCSHKDKNGSGFVKMNQELDQIKKKCEFQTIVIDSTTTMATEMMNWLINFETGIKRNRDVKSMKVASMQDYMIFAPTFANLIFALFDLPCNIIMTGHIKVQQDELTGEIHRSANIPGKIAKELPVYFPEVYVSYVKGDKYMAQTKADYKFPCRSQIPGLPKEIELSYESLVK